MQPFSAKGIIRESWDLFKNNWSVLWGALIVVLAINIIFGFAPEGQDQAVVIVAAILSFFVGRYIELGLMRISLHIAGGKPATIGQLFGEYQLVLRFIGASIIYGLIVLGGLLLLIVPGIIWSIKYGMYGYFILDKNLGVFDSIAMSGKITDGAKWQLLWVGILIGLLVLVSIIPFGLGLIVTVPMSVLITPLLYTKLVARYEGQGKKEETTTPAPTEPEASAPFVPLGQEASQA